MKGIIILLLISLTLSDYTKFPFTIEAEDCEGAGETWTSVYEKKIKGMFTGKGFAYLQGQVFSFNVSVPEDGMYQFTARMAQILNEEGRDQTISINGIDDILDFCKALYKKIPINWLQKKCDDSTDEATAEQLVDGLTT